MKKSRILITGATGFLGRNTYEAFLHHRHYDVLRMVRNTSKSDHDVIRSDFFMTDVKKNKPDVIINCSGCFGRNKESIAEIANANLFWGIKLLQLAIDAEIPYFINVNTALPANINAYSLSKNQFSQWGKLYTDCGKINFIDLRLEHIYGPEAPESNFVAFLINSMRTQVPELALTPGLQERDFIYITDAANAIEKIVATRQRFTGFNTIPVGSGEIISIKNLACMIKEATRSNTKLLFGKIPYRNNEMMKSSADISILRELGWSPQNNIKNGIGKILKGIK